MRFMQFSSPLLILWKLCPEEERWFSDKWFRITVGFLVLCCAAAAGVTPRSLLQGFAIMFVIMLLLIYIALRMYGEHFIPASVQRGVLGWQNVALGFFRFLVCCC
jgi:hypothetical protein